MTATTLNRILWTVRILLAAAFIAALAATMLVAVGVHLIVIGGSPLPAIVLGALSGFVAWQLRPGSTLLRKA